MKYTHIEGIHDDFIIGRMTRCLCSRDAEHEMAIRRPVSYDDVIISFHAVFPTTGLGSRTRHQGVEEYT